jgi:hypothetical protein
MVLEKGVNSNHFKTNKDLTNNHCHKWRRLIRRKKYSFSLQMYFFLMGVQRNVDMLKQTEQ